MTSRVDACDKYIYIYIYIYSLMAEHSDNSDDKSFFLVRIAMKVMRRNVEILLTRHK